MSGRPIHSNAAIGRWIALLVGASFLILPALAEAKVKCPAKPKNTVRAKRMAKKFFNKGGRLAQKEKYSEALDSFLCSLKMKPHENTVYNVAQVSKFVEDRDAVRERLERFLEKHPNHESRIELEELIASVEGTYEPPDDVTPVVPAPGAVEEETGPPDPAGQLVEEEEGEGEEEEQGEEEGEGEGEGEEEEGEVEELFAEPSPAVEPVDDPQPIEEDERAPPTKIAGYVLLGAAGASLVAAIALQSAAGAAKNEALRAQNYDQYLAREDKMHRRQTAAAVFWVTTGVLAGTGFVLLLLDTDEREDGSDGVELDVNAGPNGLALQGRF
jgi:hypothetical protein